MKDVQIRPIDAWFFRDGRPYVEGEANQTDVESEFPPGPRTIAGALRAATARGMGWSGGSWTSNTAIVEAVGDGPDDTGRASFFGSFVRHGDEDWFPAPQHLLLRRDEEHRPLALVGPGEPRITDIGEVRLVTPQEGGRDAEGYWVSREGLEAILRGDTPTRAVPSTEFFAHEPRIGIRRNDESRTTDEGAMYSPHYVRLRPGTSLVVRVDAVDVPESLVPFGGESRMAALTSLGEARVMSSPIDAIRAARKFAVVLLSPGNLATNRGTSPVPGDEFPGLPGAIVVSAAATKPVYLGGWSSHGGGGPLPLLPHVPAGSVYFCELEAGADIDAVLDRHDTCIGAHANLGFGHIVLGVWPDTQRS